MNNKAAFPKSERTVKSNIINQTTYYKFKRTLRSNIYIYLMILPVLLYYIIFHYGPMYGAIIAFQDFKPHLGITGSPWVGFYNFSRFFKQSDFGRLIGNTLSINIANLVFGFPVPIIFALMLNEIKNHGFKRTVQTITYMPHFISLVVMCGMILDFFSLEGIINHVIMLMGGTPVPFFGNPKYFQPIYVATNIWQEFGWDSIIYLAALASVDASLYEAAEIDGAGRFKQMLYITLPGIAPTIIILLILRVGHTMNLGPQKILLLYNSAIMEKADVISTYVYRTSIDSPNPQYSFGSAVGLFNGVINYILLIIVNKISSKVSETSLW